jgi:hypothetical protein
MTTQEFIAKWQKVELKERTATQSHFNDLCRLLGVADPRPEYFYEVSCIRRNTDSMFTLRQLNVREPLKMDEDGLLAAFCLFVVYSDRLATTQ